MMLKCRMVYTTIYQLPVSSRASRWRKLLKPIQQLPRRRQLTGNINIILPSWVAKVRPRDVAREIAPAMTYKLATRRGSVQRPPGQAAHRHSRLSITSLLSNHLTFLDVFGFLFHCSDATRLFAA